MKSVKSQFFGEHRTNYLSLLCYSTLPYNNKGLYRTIINPGAKGITYDHNWVLNRSSDGDIELAATVLEPKSGRYMEVLTTQPGIQFYGGNFFDGKCQGKSGKAYKYRESFALETQHFPDSPNRPNFPTTILNPGQEYKHCCIYKFGTR